MVRTRRLSMRTCNGCSAGAVLCWIVHVELRQRLHHGGNRRRPEPRDAGPDAAAEGGEARGSDAAGTAMQPLCDVTAAFLQCKSRVGTTKFPHKRGVGWEQHTACAALQLSCSSSMGLDAWQRTVQHFTTCEQRILAHIMVPDCCRRQACRDMTPMLSIAFEPT